MDEITRALGPWPILQMTFGLVVLGLGVWSIIRGLKGKEPHSEDQRAQWQAYNQLGNIEANTSRIVKAQEQIAAAVNRLVDVVWNNQRLTPR